MKQFNTKEGVKINARILKHIHKALKSHKTNETTNYTSQETKNLFNKTTTTTETKDKFDKINYTPKNKYREMHHCAPKNINCYRHLLNPKANSNFEQIDWTVRLREPIEFKYSNNNNEVIAETVNDNSKFVSGKGFPLTSHFNPPSFYREDLEKHLLKRKLRPCTSECNRNFYNISHLSKPNINGSVNKSNYDFSLNLRNEGRTNIKSAKTYNRNENFNNNKRWHMVPFNQTFTSFSVFEKPRNEKCQENYEKIDKYLCKPVKYKYEETSVGKDLIKRKKVLPDINEFFSGVEHSSYKPYTSNYKDKNTFCNKEMLSKETNSMCLFALNLREYGPITHKKIRRLKKIDMDKMKEDKVNANKIFYFKYKMDAMKSKK